MSKTGVKNVALSVAIPLLLTLLNIFTLKLNSGLTISLSLIFAFAGFMLFLLITLYSDEKDKKMIGPILVLIQGMIFVEITCVLLSEITNVIHMVTVIAVWIVLFIGMYVTSYFGRKIEQKN